MCCASASTMQNQKKNVSLIIMKTLKSLKQNTRKKVHAKIQKINSFCNYQYFLDK